MYWFRPEIFSREMMQNMSSLIFDEELGQDDGTLAHGFERIVGVLVQKSKYFMAEHEFKSNNV
jgi:lipopolysaccharide biosynthesis protein